MRKQFSHCAAVFALAVAAVVLAGCAVPAHRENMSAAPTAAVRKLPYSVRVETRGGSETSAMDSSNVSNADLKAAIEASIAQSGLFKTVVQGKDGDYELTVSVTVIDKPMFGGAFTVVLETGWSLVKTSDKSIAMRKVIKSSHTAGFSDSIMAMTRLRLAVEGAVRNNIAAGLQAISALPI